MKKVRFYLAAMAMVLTAVLFPAVSASAEVPSDVKAVCGIIDEVAGQLVEISKGRQVNPSQTLMQLLPYTASTTGLDAESQALISESSYKMMVGMLLASGQTLPDEAKAQLKAEIEKEMQEEKVLGPFVTDMLSQLMGGGE